MGKYEPDSDYELDEYERGYRERISLEHRYKYEEEDDLNAEDAGFMRGYMEA